MRVHQINYIEPVYRPPSEWKSLILQVTNGCSWNHCTFCEMYQAPQKSFNHRSLNDLKSDLQKAKDSQMSVSRVFLADGDVMTLSTRRLKQVLSLVRKFFPQVQRISAYCLPRNLLHKSITELMELNTLGLKLLYIGCESGDDEVLDLVNKGETYSSSLDALKKLKAANIKSSVMILNGLGGTLLSQQHALQSAKLMNEAQPDYLSTLVVSFPLGVERFKERFKQFESLTQVQLFEEMLVLLQHLELDKTIFRSDHASNYLILKGVLGRDKQKLLNKINTAIYQPEQIPLRQEFQRGL